MTRVYCSTVVQLTILALRRDKLLILWLASVGVDEDLIVMLLMLLLLSLRLELRLLLLRDEVVLL